MERPPRVRVGGSNQASRRVGQEVDRTRVLVGPAQVETLAGDRQVPGEMALEVGVTLGTSGGRTAEERGAVEGMIVLRISFSP